MRESSEISSEISHSYVEKTLDKKEQREQRRTQDGSDDRTQWIEIEQDLLIESEYDEKQIISYLKGN